MNKASKSENFQLKKGVIRHLTSKNMHVSNENLTDDLAIQMIKERPSRKADFDVLPENIDELISSNGSVPSKPAEKKKAVDKPSGKPEKPSKPAEKKKA